MDKPTDAPTLALDPSEDELLGVEYQLPRSDIDPDEQPEVVRERYDKQILGALVSP